MRLGLLVGALAMGLAAHGSSAPRPTVLSNSTTCANLTPAEFSEARLTQLSRDAQALVRSTGKGSPDANLRKSLVRANVYFDPQRRLRVAFPTELRTGFKGSYEGSEIRAQQAETVLSDVLKGYAERSCVRLDLDAVCLDVFSSTGDLLVSRCGHVNQRTAVPLDLKEPEEEEEPVLRTPPVTEVDPWSGTTTEVRPGTRK